MKQWILALGVLALGWTAPVGAELCSQDAVPAATLLLPYFEVCLDLAGEVNTLFSINNASQTPTVAHVTLWGDWSQPSIDFDVFLTGYDVQTISLKPLFFSGILPITAHSTNDQGNIYGGVDSISPHGNNPAWDSAPDNGANPLFPACDSNLPLDGNNPGQPVLDQALLDRIRNGHSGLPDASFGGDCIGAFYDDNTARGYITIDNVTDCNVLFPAQPGYFGTGLVSNVNQLWGDYFIVNRHDGFAFGDALVHIEASSTAFAPGDYTFYGRYVDGLATDGREPLGTVWASRYLSTDTGFDGGTDLIVWRDSKFTTTAEAYDCDTGPPWFPLNETQVVAFDEQEDATEICLPAPGGISGISPPPAPGLDPTCFPLETGRYRVGEGELQQPFPYGWMYLNLNHTLAVGPGDPFPGLAQSVVSTNMDSFHANLSVGFPAVQLDNACTGTNPVIVGNL